MYALCTLYDILSCAHHCRSSVGFGHLQQHLIIALGLSLKSMILKVGPVSVMKVSVLTLHRAQCVMAAARP